MKRKIIGIFVIVLLTISYMPIIGSEASQVPESNENKGGNIKIFFIGVVMRNWAMTNDSSLRFLAYFGIFKDISRLYLEILGKNYILLVDGEEIKLLEPPCGLEFYNFTGIGTPDNLLWTKIVKLLIPNYPYLFCTVICTIFGSCTSYRIINYN